MIPIFCFKRILVAVGTIFIMQPVAVNIMIYIYTSLFSLGFNMTYRPLVSPNLNRIDNINELFVLCTSYFMLAFSGWTYVPSKEGEYDLKKCNDNPLLRYKMGDVYIPFLGLALAFNLTIILFEMTKGLKLKFRKTKYKYMVK